MPRWKFWNAQAPAAYPFDHRLGQRAICRTADPDYRGARRLVDGDGDSRRPITDMPRHEREGSV